LKYTDRKMFPIPLALIVMLFLTPGLFAFAGGQTRPEIHGQGVDFQIHESSFEAITGTVQFQWPVSGKLETPGGTFSTVEITGTTPTSQIGKPELPVLRKLFHIPAGAEPSLILTILEEEKVSAVDIGVEYPIVPVQPPVPKRIGALEEIEFVIDKQQYREDRYYPEGEARIIETGVIRGHSYVLVEIYPLRYNPVRDEFSLVTSVDLEIRLTGSDEMETGSAISTYGSLPFEKILSGILVNHDAYHPVGINSLPAPLGLLIVVPDAYYTEALAYTDWKIQKGFHTTVAPLSETGSTRDEIFDYVQNAYLTWEVPPTYLLLFGDTNLIPCYTGSAGNHETDLKYVSVDGGDWLPDMIVGRFPFRTSGQLQAMLDKSLDYETLNLPGTDFLNETCFIASDDPWFWDLAEDTHRYVIMNYMRPNGIFWTAIRGHFGGNTQDIRDAVNAGQTFVNYSGHGSAVGWGGPSFSQNDVRNLTNQDMYPWVISHACDTGRYEETECFGETWVRETNRGGLAFWGASNSTYWDEDDFLERRMYDANFLRDYTTIGEQAYAGLYWMYYGGWNRSQYYFEAYNILGDPLIDLYIGYPFVGEITYAGTIGVGPQDFVVEVLDGSDGVEYALVCLMKGKEVYETGYTDESGTVTLSIDPTSPGTLEVTVTAHNMVPHEGTVTVETGRRQ
jgi:hypothetical protein